MNAMPRTPEPDRTDAVGAPTPQPVVGLADGTVRGWVVPFAVATADRPRAEVVGQMLRATSGAWFALDAEPADLLGLPARRRLEDLAALVAAESESEPGPARLAVRLAERDLSALGPSLARHLSDLLSDCGVRLIVRGVGVGPEPARPGFLDDGLAVSAVGLHPALTVAIADSDVARVVSQLGSRLSGLGIAGVAEGVTAATPLTRLLHRGWALGEGPRFAAVVRPRSWYAASCRAA